MSHLSFSALSVLLLRIMTSGFLFGAQDQFPNMAEQDMRPQGQANSLQKKDLNCLLWSNKGVLTKDVVQRLTDVRNPEALLDEILKKVEKIDHEAFTECSAFVSVVIPGNIRAIRSRF